MLLHHAMAWGCFLLLVLFLLGLDLFVLHRKPHAIKLKEALLGAALPVLAASLFGIAVYFAYDKHWLDLGLRHRAQTAPAQVQAETTDRSLPLPPDIHAKYYPSTGADALIVYFTGYLVELSL